MKLINYGYFYERPWCPHWLFTDVYGGYHCYLYIRKKGKNTHSLLYIMREGKSYTSNIIYFLDFTVDFSVRVATLDNRFIRHC